MNNESKRALQRRLNEINTEIDRIKLLLDKAEETFKQAKLSRDDLKTNIDNLQIEKQKIKEDVGV